MGSDVRRVHVASDADEDKLFGEATAHGVCFGEPTLTAHSHSIRGSILLRGIFITRRLNQHAYGDHKTVL